MKTKIALFFFLSISFLSLNAQQGAVRNQSVRISEEQDKVTIMYDLISSGSMSKLYSIKVDIFLDERKLDLRGLSGDLGNQVSPGLGKKIIWDVLTDIAELSGELKIKVYEDKPVQSTGLPCPLSTGPAYTGLSAFVGVGGTAILLGVSQYNDAVKWYEKYESEPTIDMEEFNKQKSNFTTNSKVFIGAGAGMIAVGLIAFINKISKVSKYNRECKGTGSTLQEPKIELKPILTGSVAATPGFGISLKFN